MPTSIRQFLTNDVVRRKSSRSAFERGEEYSLDGRVHDLKEEDSVLRAVVQGSDAYEVELQLVDGKLISHCSCPMGVQGVFCKHCVATALTAIGPAEVAPEIPSGDRFEKDTELDEFLASNGLQHVRMLGGEVLLPYLPERDRSAVRYVLSRQRLSDVATVQSVRRYGYALAYAPKLRDRLPFATWDFVHRELDEVQRAKSEVSRRLTVPEDVSTHEVFRALIALRERHPSAIAPRPEEVLQRERLGFSETLPGFLWMEDRPSLPLVGHLPSVPSVELRLGAGAASFKCSHCSDSGCSHSLDAIDAALLFLHGPPNELRSKMLEELRRPVWDRALRALDRAIEEENRPTAPVFVSWRVEVVDPNRVVVTPWLHKVTRKGGLTSGSRVTPQRLLSDLREKLAPEDRRVAEAMVRTQMYFAAERPVLEAMIGHPRVALEKDPEITLRVESATVGLLAEQRAESVILVPAIEGAALSADLVRLLQDHRDDDRPLVVFDEGGRKLTLLKVPAETRRTLEVLERFGNDFPPESHAALVEKLSNLSARVPVALPRSVMGEEVAPELKPVIRVQVHPDGQVRIETRIRPLPESAAFVPGEGVKEVHVRREGKPVHARRDFAKELEEAIRVTRSLPLMEASQDGDYGYVLPDAQSALGFLSRLEEQTSKPELEWTNRPLRVVGSARAPSLKVVLERRRDWFGVTGSVRVAGERIELAVLLDAARRQERYVRLSEGKFVEVSEALRERLKALSDHTWKSSNGTELGISGAEALDALHELGAEVSADKQWRELTAKIFAAKELNPRVPPSLKAELRDYQHEGFQWLTRLASWGAGGVLADDMGLGKTVQALGVLLDRAKLGPQLVIAPTSVGFNWIDEAARFAPSLKLQVYAESLDRGASLESLKARDVLVLSYGLLARDAERLAKVKFSTIVFDEAQALKNATTQRAKAARELQGDFKFALSGTPLENHLGELWSIYRIVFPGLLGSWDSFRDRFATPIEKKIDPTAAPALSRVLQPFLLRRTKDQVAKELPPRTDIRVPIVLSPEEWQLYEDARLAAVDELESPKSKLREQQRRIQILASLTRLRLLASHPRLYDIHSELESSKLRRLMELVDELVEEGHRALVFSQFTSHLKLVREVLDERGIRYQYLDGTTPRKEREQVVREFQEGNAPLFLISLKAGGFGLNLTGADYVIHLDPWWNPAVEDQASDRAHRIGQSKPVTVYRLVAKGTIEEQILSLHEEKRELVTGVLDGKDSAGRLSTRELLSLLSQPAAPLADMESPSEARH